MLLIVLDIDAVATFFRPGTTVLELGAGCGYLGMTLARNIGGSMERLCLTEME